MLFLKIWLVPEDVSQPVREKLLEDIWKALVAFTPLGLTSDDVSIALSRDQLAWELGGTLIAEGEFKSDRDGLVNGNLELAAKIVVGKLVEFAETHLNNTERLEKEGMVQCTRALCTLKVLGSNQYGHMQYDIAA